MIEVPTILRADVEWFHKYANDPELILFVDEAWHFPNPFSTWEHRLLESTPGGDIYLATKGVWAHFVCDATKPGQKTTTELDGQCIGNLKLHDGSVKVYNGWSSRAGVINLFLPPEDHIVDVVLWTGTDRTQGMGRHGIAVRKDALGEFLPDGIHLVQPSSEPCYVPSIDLQEVVKP
jgi:hypothetical protein